MWELAQILFDSQDPDLDDLTADRIRKRNLSQFWKSIVTPAAMEQARNAASAESRALAQLSALDIWSATETLLNSGDYRLGTVIAQIGADKDTRDSMVDQIESWREKKMLSEIPISIRALHEILAGNTGVSGGIADTYPEDRAETFNIAQRFGLDWRQAFGLKLWYGTSLEDPISDAVDLFAEDIANQSDAVKPEPPGKESSGHQDIMWGLLETYAAQQRSRDAPTDADMGLGNILEPENMSGDPLNAMLSFQLYQALCARNLIKSESAFAEKAQKVDGMTLDDLEDKDSFTANHKSDLLTSILLSSLSSSANELASAVFTALHLSSPAARSEAVKTLLNRHAGALGEDRSSCPLFRRLVDELKIPAAWIWSAKAIYASTVKFDFESQCICLLEAGQVAEAHEVLQKTVAPQCIIESDASPLVSSLSIPKGSSNDDSSGLHRLSRIVKTFEAKGAPGQLQPETWQHGGGIYSAFVKLPDVARQIRTHSTGQGTPSAVAEGKRLVAKAREGLPRREVWERLGLEERVGLWELSRCLDEFERSCLHIDSGRRAGLVKQVDADVVQAEGLAMSYFENMRAAVH